jgi:hypothetical protein
LAHHMTVLRGIPVTGDASLGAELIQNSSQALPTRENQGRLGRTPMSAALFCFDVAAFSFSFSLAGFAIRFLSLTAPIPLPVRTCLKLPQEGSEVPVERAIGRGGSGGTDRRAEQRAKEEKQREATQRGASLPPPSIGASKIATPIGELRLTEKSTSTSRGGE